jgi:hypothetical protein
MLPDDLKKKLETARDAFLCDYFQDTEACVAYAEPGYTDPTDSEETGLHGLIVFADWNDTCSYCSRLPHEPTEHVFTGNITEALKAALAYAEVTADEETLLAEELGNDKVENWFNIEPEWCDEWTTCDDCGRALRTSPDCYSWKRSYLFIEGEGDICVECLEQDPDAYFDLVKNRDVDGGLIDPEQHGWIHVPKSQYSDTWENGLHEHMAADPGGQIDVANDLGLDVVFKIYPSQFYVAWDLFVRGSEYRPEEVTDEMRASVIEAVRTAISDSSDCTQSPSPATLMQAYLRDATTKTAGLDKADGVIHTSPDPNDPTKAVVRQLTPEEFIDGSWARKE